MDLLSSMAIDVATVAGTLTSVNEEASRSRTAVLRSGCSAAAEAVGRGARGPVQGTLRSGPRGDRESARRARRDVYLQPDRIPRAVTADGLPPPPRLEGSGLDRDRQQARDLYLVPPGARGDAAARLRDRRQPGSRRRARDPRAGRRLVRRLPTHEQIGRTAHCTQAPK